MKSKRSKMCDITQKVKNIVWERDGCCCIICGSPQAMPNAHFIPRAHGGLGIEKNIVTLCLKCHDKYDKSTSRPEIKKYIMNYLKHKYPDWDEGELIFKK